MITNELLQEKYRVQRLLDKQANHDLAQYVANSHARVKEIEARFDIKFKYGVPSIALQELASFLDRTNQPK